MNSLGATLRGEMIGLNNSLAQTLRGEMIGLNNSLAETLRAEIRAGDEETRRQMRELHEVAMRVLHEEVISRIALLDEGLNGRKRSRNSRGSTGKTPRAPKR